MQTSLYRITPLAWTVVRRNFLVWRRVLGPALVMNFGEPLLYLFGLGYGLGLYIGEISGIPYLTFLASGIIATSAMNSATFEGTYAVFARMVLQHTHQGMLATPLRVDDILTGELLWCAIKGTFSAAAILLVATLFGAVPSVWSVFTIPLALLIGLAFAGPAIAMSAISPNYEFFSYYLTLVITPLHIFSGVFYPLSILPAPLQWLMQCFPLTHAIALTRPLVAGLPVNQPLLHIAVLLLYAAVGYLLAVRLTHKRLLV